MLSLHYATTEAAEISSRRPAARFRRAKPPSLPNALEYYLEMNALEARGEINLDDPPGLQIVSPSVADPSRAPAGCHTVKIESNLPVRIEGRAQALGQYQGPSRGRPAQSLAAICAEPHAGQISGKIHRKPARYRAHESVDVAGQHARRRDDSLANRKHAPRARLGKLPHAHRRTLSDRSLHRSGRRGHRNAGTKCGNGDSQGFRDEP